jgi:hypothetical protein
VVPFLASFILSKLGYALVGAMFGILLGVGLAISARARQERNALTAALITLFAMPVLLLAAFLILIC